jgi:C-terminal processing protease CtpA/Prc
MSTSVVARQLLCCLIVSLIAVLPAAAQTPNTEAERTRIERLAALGRVWGVVNYFHPYLAYKQIDWDAALIAAVPKVSAATSTEDYRAAIDGLLATLGDPGTHTALDTPVAVTPTAPEQPWRVVNDMLVLTCHSLGDLVWNNGTAIKPITDYLAGNPKGVVFDCRTRRTGPDGLALFSFQFALGLVDQMVSGTVTLATYRERQHSGYVPQSGMTSGGYWSGFMTRVPGAIEGRRKEPVPLAFIVDAGTPGLEKIVGLQAANLAQVVEEVDGSAAKADGAGYATQLPGGFYAFVRTTELLSPTGEAGFHPDVTVSATTGEDAALNAAIKSLAAPPPSRPALATPVAQLHSSRDRPYPQMTFPSAEYRLLALFRFWNVIHYFFPYQHLMDRDWDPALAEFIPRFEANQNTFDYQTTVTALAKRLQDSHVGVGNATAINDHLGMFAPPITVRSIEDETVIVALSGPAAEAAGLKIGDVVLAVDDEPIEQRRARLEQFYVASTPQAMQHRVAQNILRGAKDKPAKLRVKRDDTLSDVEVPRSVQYFSVASPPNRTAPATYEILPSGYGYVDLARLQPAEVEAALDAAFAAPAIIFDMRGYPNGTGFVIGPRLIKGDKPIAGAQFRRPFHKGSAVSSDDDGNRIDHAFAQTFSPSSKPRYAGKVVMLIDERAISQAEHTCLIFSAATEVTFIGTPTNGANGDITDFLLPGALRIVFTGHDVRYGDGRQLQRVGVQPHVTVAPSIKGVREGRDEVLDAAVKYLQAPR